MGRLNRDAVIAIDGTRDTVSQILPSLELPAFPNNSS